MRVITKPSSSTLCEIEVTTSEAKEKELLELGEEVYKFLNPDNRVVISSKGKVLVKSSKGFYRLVKQFKDEEGYHRVLLNNETYLVDHLVAETFIGDPSEELFEIEHINGIIDDDDVKNLKWVTPRYAWKNIRAVKPYSGESALFSNLYMAMPFIKGISGNLGEVVKAIEKQKKYRGYFWNGDRTLLP